MKLYTDLDIVNRLSTCRDVFEAKAYLKANNIDISDQELEVLQSQCNKINSERTLTKELLNKVAGGGKSWHGGSPRTKSLDAGRPRSSSCSDISDMPQEFTPEHDQLTHQMKEAVRTFAALSKEAEQAKIQAERTAEEERAKTIQFMDTFPGMQEFYKKFLITDMIQGLAEDACQKDLQVKELTRLLTETRLQLNKTQEREQSLRQLVYRMRGLNPHRVGEAQDQVSSLSGQEYGRASRHYAPTPVPSSVPDPESPPRFKPTYSLEPNPAPVKEKSSSFNSGSTPVVRVNAKGGAFSRVFGSQTVSSEESLSFDAETDSDTSSGSSSPTNSTFATFDKDATLQGQVPFFRKI